jgi:hypothetical protein
MTIYRIAERSDSCSYGGISIRRKVTPLLLTLWLLTVLFSFASSLVGQTNAVDGVMDGYVRSTDDALLPGATIIATNIATGVAQTTRSDDAGYFRFPLVHTGTYDLQVSAPGFATLNQRGVSIGVGSGVHLMLRMFVSSDKTSITVNADASILETHSSAMGATLDQDSIEDLPIITRDVYNLFLFSPGIKGVPSTGFGTPTLSFGGIQRTQWNVDGQDNTSRQFTSNIRLVVNTPETLQSTQVMSNGYSAEFGRSAGGQVNLFTRAGTNAYHGQVLGFFRPYSLQAIKGPTVSGSSPSVAEQHWDDFAFTFGGPILRDRLFFFANYEVNPYVIPTSVTVLPANAVTLGLPSSYTNQVPTGQTYKTPSGRLDFNLGKANSGFLRYMHFTNNQRYSSAGGLSVISRGLNFHDTQDGAEAQLVTVISPTTLNELRFGAVQRDQLYVNEVPPNATDVNINISGIANFGNSVNAGSHNFEQDFQLIDNLTHSKGRHTLKAGADIETTSYFVRSSQSPTYTFQNLAQYQNTLAGKATYFQLALTLGNPILEQRFFFYNGFAQDEFRLSPRLTINYGLRYQYVQVPELDANAPNVNSRYARTDKLDISPRFSFTVSPFADNKTVIRGAYGIYFDTPSLSFFQSAAQTNGDPDRLQSYVISGTAAGAPVFPAIPTSAGLQFVTKPNIVTFDPNFRIMYAHQANLQVERQITNDLSINLQYNMLLSRFGAYEHDMNLAAPTGTLADGRPIYGGTRPNSQFAAIYQLTSGSNSNYHALDITVSKRTSHGFEFGTTYSYSKALGTGDQIGSVMTDPSSLARDYGRLSADLHHFWTFQGTYRTSGYQGLYRAFNGILFSTMTFVHSGYPLNPYSGSDLNKDGNANDRPLFASRNSVNGPHFYQVDFRMAKDITFFDRYHLELRAEAQDLLNHQNADCNATSGCSSALQNNVTTTTFGQIQTARIPRQVQFGGRVYF